MKIALDTNVLACAERTNGAAMRNKALDLIQRLPGRAIVLPVQTLGELINVLVRKPSTRPLCWLRRRKPGAACFCRRISRKALPGGASP